MILCICLIALLFLILLASLDLYFGYKAFHKYDKTCPFKKRNSETMLITDGNDLYKHLLDDITEASSSISMLFYIVRNDDTSEKFLSLLEKKAQQGLQVRLLVDWIGSFRLKRKRIKKLKENGVEVLFNRRTGFPYTLYRFQHRNHRKITVIDQKTGYFGGFNIGKEYIGFDEDLGYWRDYHIRMTGEGVKDLHIQFLIDWVRSGGESFTLINDDELAKGKIEHHFYSSDFVRIENLYKDLIDQAKKHIYIGTPYFIPTKKLMNSLLAALKRGVRISVMIPEKEDHRLVKEASFPHLLLILEGGGEVFHYQKGFFHAKVLLIDDHFCDVGSVNFDRRSLCINDEWSCIFSSESFILKIKEIFTKDLERSKTYPIGHYKNTNFLWKCRKLLSKLLSPLM
ncbi:cardiolipin synthase [Gottfriedia acidiceleris]|uniref:Cardiolipin synthase n=1 Tax=Gottfriedia acidiceleris TaxID=371036 RepID=A0ABY4JM27_9BACI|nr:cardiolipin synthase [Gottfriedia acidiceleris]UPM54264.1 cardiolipin synthase [Gottfriedia acidiceleris]